SVGHCGREALVAGVVHDRIGIDRARAAHWLELQIDADALHTGGIGWMLEAAAALATLQLERAASRRLPERPCPLVRDRHGPCHLAPIAHASCLVNGLSDACRPSGSPRIRPRRPAF